MEDYLFVNQLITKDEYKKLLVSKHHGNKDLVQESHQNLLDLMDTKHNKLFEIAKKKIGIDKTVF